MKKILLALITITSFLSCVENDYIDDRIDERLSINTIIQELQVDETYQLEAQFFNNVGEATNSQLTWSSSNDNIATVNQNGLLTAVSEGTVTITVETNAPDAGLLKARIDIEIIAGTTNNNPISKSGTITTTSSYTLEGNFTISEIANSTNLKIEVADNYKASSSLPGLYLYLSNNPNSIGSAIEIGAVQVFNGAHEYTINNTSINDYKYLVYWCKPFSVKVGHGEIED